LSKPPNDWRFFLERAAGPECVASPDRAADPLLGGNAGSHSHLGVLGLPSTTRKEHLMTTPKLSALNVVSNRERYGSVVGQPAPERALRLGKAVKLIIAADGEVSEGELSAFADLATMFGATELFSQLVAFDPRSTTLQDCLQGLDNDALARRMIYDAIKISSVDGYAAQEREAVTRAAQIMGIDGATVTLIEGLVEAERGLASIRAKLLAEK
jgi:tellurite resistance protein